MLCLYCIILDARIKICYCFHYLINEIARGALFPFGNFLKRFNNCKSCCKKGISCSLNHFALGIHDFLQHRSHFATMLGEFECIIKNVDDIYNSFYHPRSSYSSKHHKPYHLQTDLIWCDGPFINAESTTHETDSLTPIKRTILLH
jgi:hypothetical protein